MGDARAIAEVQVAGWQAAYRGLSGTREIKDELVHLEMARLPPRAHC